MLRFTTVVLFVLAVLSLSGCTDIKDRFSVPTSTPVPVPTVATSPSPTPGPDVNPSVEKQYQYTEKMNMGIEEYNRAIELMWQGYNLWNASQYSNASRTMLLAKQQMEVAGIDFLSMKQYASSTEESNLSDHWVDTTKNAAKSYQYDSDAFLEYGNQSLRPTMNLVKFNYYVNQANYYHGLSVESRAQVDALMKNVTFYTPSQTR
jgi:hypothetical protein